MDRFSTRLLGFLSLQLALVVGVFALRPAANDRPYLAAWTSKYERLASLEGPRLIVTGGSDVAFGIHAQALEHALGVPAVNMGLHGGLGMRLALEPVLPHLRPGDVVLVSLVEELFLRREAGGDLLAQLVSSAPGAAQHLRPIDWKNAADQGHLYLGGRVKSGVFALLGLRPAASPPPYSLSSFNAWGDVVGHRSLDAPPLPRWTSGVERRQLNIDAGVALLELFVRQAEAQGAVVAWFFPPLLEEYLDQRPHVLAQITERLWAIDGLIVLDSAEDNRHPRDDFFDTRYHLRYEAAAERTKRLIEALRASDRAN